MSDIVVHKQFTTPKNDITVENSGGRSIQEFLEFLQIPANYIEHSRVYVGDILVDPKMYKHVRPKCITPVKVIILPEGDVDSILPIIAMIAISVAAPYIAGPAVLGLEGFAAAAVTVGITIAGSLLINAMFPPPEAPEAVSRDSDASKALTLSGSRNQFRYDDVIPRIYGTVKVYPPHAAQPYTVSSGGVQYLHMIFDLGYAPIQITDLKIGETLISEYSEVETVYHESIDSGETLKFFTSDIDNTSVNVELNDGDPATSRTTSTLFKYAQFDLLFNGGLYGLDSEAAIVSETVTFEVTVKDDLGTLIPDANILVNMLQPGGSNISTEKSSTTDFTITGSTEQGFSITGEVWVEIGTVPDFITIELARISSTENGISTVDNCAYGTLRTFRLSESIKTFRLIESGPVYASHTMLEMRIRATDQLNGIIDNFNCIASSKLRKWNGTSFDTPTVTDNPAWIYADILTGTMNQRPKDDTRLNWNELKRWADFCDTLAMGQEGISTKAHTCNFILDYSSTLFNLLSEVASVGRASPDIYDDMYSVIFDEPKTTKIQLFSNMNTAEFSSSRVYTEMPDAVRITFRDPDSDWQMRELVVYNDGFNIDTAKIFEDIKAPMLTSSNEAYRNGRYWLKQAALRKESITFKTDLEWLECKRGSYVGLQMDVMKIGGTAARIKSVNSQVVTVDTDPAMNGNGVNYFELRTSSGVIISGPVAFYHAGDAFNVDLGIDGATAGDMIVFNDATEETYELLIKRIDVSEDQSAKITCVEYVPALYALASDPVPTYDPSIGNIYTPNSVPLSLESVWITEELNFISKTPYITLTIYFNPAIGSIPSYYRIYKQDPNTYEWIFQGNTTNTYFVWGDSILAIDNPIIGQQHCFSVVGVSEDGDFMNPALATQACIVPSGDDTIPPTPDHFVVEDTAENFRRFWWGYQTTTPPEDLIGFVIRYTRSSLADWSSASPLHDGILENPPFEIRALPTGTQIVMIRSIDSSGNLSSEISSISFNMGDRPVENVLDTTSFDPSWTGTLISGSGEVVTGVLTVDTDTSGLMWNTIDTTLMWLDNAAPMWTEHNDSFKWIEEVTISVGGITTIDWAGAGEVQISYVEGVWPDDFIQAENLLLYPEEFTHASWLGVLPVLQTTVKGPDASPRVYRIEDDSAAAIENINISYTTGFDITKYYFASVSFKKDSTAKTTRFVGITLEFSGGSYEESFASLDTSTGEVDGFTVTGTYGVIDEGEYWRLYLSAISVNQSNNTVKLNICPAQGANANMVTRSITALGTADIFGALLAEQDSFAIIKYVPLSFLFYTGTNQGVIPYRSPINLEAGTYSVIIDSAKSIDVNTLTSLDWITDVPDINEYFEDKVVSSTGDTTITLTKTFDTVTNISIVLQDDTNGATSCIIMSKTNLPTSFTIRCYDDTDPKAQVQGLVDIRVQGY